MSLALASWENGMKHTLKKSRNVSESGKLFIVFAFTQQNTNPDRLDSIKSKKEKAIKITF